MMTAETLITTVPSDMARASRSRANSRDVSAMIILAARHALETGAPAYLGRTVYGLAFADSEQGAILSGVGIRVEPDGRAFELRRDYRETAA